MAEQAEGFYRGILEIREQEYGPDHPRTLTARTDVAVALARQTKMDAAEPMFRDVVDKLRAAIGPEFAVFPSALASFGQELTDHERPVEAEPLLRECLKLREQNLPPRHRLLGNAQSLLGGCLTKLGQYEAAERLLLAGHNVLMSAPATRPRLRLDCLDRLVDQGSNGYG